MSLPNTNARVFYAYSIEIDGNPIGTISDFTPSSTKTIERVREVAFNQGPKVRELVPGVTDISISVTKIFLYSENIFEASGMLVKTIEDVQTAFEVNEIAYRPSHETKEMITYHGCQFSDYGKSISTGTTIVNENVTIQVAYATGADVSV